MQKMLELVSRVEDRRQRKKVRYKMSDIITIVLLASLGNANEWMEIYYFAEVHTTNVVEGFHRMLRKFAKTKTISCDEKIKERGAAEAAAPRFHAKGFAHEYARFT